MGRRPRPDTPSTEDILSVIELIDRRIAARHRGMVLDDVTDTSPSTIAEAVAMAAAVRVASALEAAADCGVKKDAVMRHVDLLMEGRK